MPHRTTTRTVAIVLVVGLIAVPPGAAGQSTIVTLDKEAAIASEAAVQEYKSDGVVTRQLGAFAGTVTVADNAEDVGLSGWTRASSTNTYLRLQYNESITRTIRFYVPSEMWKPRVKQGLQPTWVGIGDTSPAVDLDPTKDRQYTAVTVRLEGPTDAVYAVSSVSGTVFDIRSDLSELTNNTTGISLPRLGLGGTEWHYVPHHQLSGSNATAVINTTTDELTIQYDADPDPGEEHRRWIPVPSCEDGIDQPVCRFRKDDSTTVYLLSTVEDPPPVRYTAKPGLTSSGGSIADQIASLPGRVWSDLESLWPGGA